MRAHAVSLACYAFLRPLRHADRLGAADQAMRAQMLRVLIATVVAVVSTLVCYINPLVGIAHPWIFFALDSVINDLCLAILALTDAEGDATLRATRGPARVGVAPTTRPGWPSGGAMLSCDSSSYPPDFSFSGFVFLCLEVGRRGLFSLRPGHLVAGRLLGARRPWASAAGACRVFHTPRAEQNAHARGGENPNQSRSKASNRSSSSAPPAGHACGLTLRFSVPSAGRAHQTAPLSRSGKGLANAHKRAT